MKACKGPGKTCLLAWLIWNFLLTRRRSKVAATSITEDNLRDGLWAELAKWQSMSPLLTQAFTWSQTRIICNEMPAAWFAAAKTWPRTADPQRQASTLAGFHEDNTLFVLDESGAMPQAIMTTAEASLASGIENKLVQAGNPETLEGPLLPRVQRGPGAVARHRDHRRPRVPEPFTAHQGRMGAAGDRPLGPRQPVGESQCARPVPALEPQRAARRRGSARRAAPASAADAA